MYCYWKPILSVGALQQKSAAVCPRNEQSPLQRPKIRTYKYENESLSFRESMVWNQPSNRYYAAKFDDEFKMKRSSWKGSGYVTAATVLS